jgi:hypothetical protein
VEGANLSPPVGKQFVAADRAADHLINVFSGLILAIDFLVLAIGEFGSDEAAMSGEKAEPVRRRGVGWSRLGDDS